MYVNWNSRIIIWRHASLDVSFMHPLNALIFLLVNICTKNSTKILKVTFQKCVLNIGTQGESLW